MGDSLPFFPAVSNPKSKKWTEKMSERTKGRELALRILYGQDFSASDEKPFDRQVNWWNPDDRFHAGKAVQPFGLRIAKDVTANRESIDAAIISIIEHWAMNRLTPVDRNLLRIGVYEIFHRPDIPPPVTINELIELAKVYGDENSGTFINGVLDALLKQESAQPEGSEPETVNGECAELG